MADGLSAATLAIYIVLLIPTVYILVKHGRQGLLGWLFLAIFCTIRIIGSGLAVGSSSSAASIISGVGLSPLLFASCGILREAKTYRLKSLNRRLEGVFDFFFHMLVAAGVVLTAIASAKLQRHENVEKAERQVKAGMAILAIAWVFLVGWTAMSFMGARRTTPVVKEGTVLLSTVCFSLTFIGVRVFYSLVAMCTQRADLNPTTGSLAIRVVLGFLPELIAAIAYVAAGMKTQNASKHDQEEQAGEWAMAKQPPVEA
ncbi:hypothetical protein P170DRAFT_426812 [Aspergillus steynii IBT 23096]|uniref:DUF7702 domain-containing protein n=1 Tax=Aspergillus steynii IBT 23096 TaxID=1392250 RepID=A0A2I2G3W6_9EURO|nr:uncharacterized protein P170DRAFT_426812 [Aspergillus steynii IBT 23096]PLB47570.1 hypothetical protein P170DRAFT_426812 [Aspergillus steynii IBT 23096]